MVDAPWLASSRNVAVEAAAGTGKTTLIASAVELSVSHCQLVLTHTHAGVGAIQKSLDKKGVPASRFHVDTIAGWAYRYARSYPKISGLDVQTPGEEDWDKVYLSALATVQNKAIRSVIQETYGGLYVDEYQDCTKDQHALIVALAEILPCRVLGDPLQGIFDFVKTGLVDWSTEVGSTFRIHQGPTHPWRWEGKNPKLGHWLGEVRKLLLQRKPIDLRDGPIIWKPLTPGSARKTQIASAKFLKVGESETVIALQKWAPTAVKFAGVLGGRFTNVEPIDCPALFKFAKGIQETKGFDRAIAVIDFAAQCMTSVGTQLSTIRKSFVVGKVPNIRKAQKELEVLLKVVNSSEIGPVIDALEVIRRIPTAKMFRRELFNEMKRAIENQDPGVDLSDSAWNARNVTRHSGRRLFDRSVGTTLLVKGLEFDHAVVIDGEAVGHSREHLYVALTRASRSLTVLSKSPILPP